MENKNLAELRKKRVDSFVNTIPEMLRFDPSNPQSQDYLNLSLINLLPKNRCVLITQVKEEQVTEGGIYMPSIEQEAMVNDRTDVSSYFGMIIAASPDAIWYEKPNGEKVPYQPGDLCIYAKHRETYVRYGTHNFIMCSDFDIWGVIPDNAYYEYVFDAKADVFHNLRSRVKSKQDILDRENPEKRKK